MDRVAFGTSLWSSTSCRPAVCFSLLLLLVSTLTNLAQVVDGGCRKQRIKPVIDAFGNDCGKAQLADWSAKYQNAFTCPKLRRNHLEPAADEMSSLDEGDEDAGLRISGGFLAKEAEIPSYVQLLVVEKGGKTFYRCGGTLINKNMVLTASHCVASGYDRIWARAGLVRDDRDTDSGYQKRKASRVCRMPGYEFDKTEPSFAKNDIALVILEEPFKYTERVQPACLVLDQEHARGASCFTVGMGTANNSNIYSNELKVLPVQRATCLWPTEDDPNFHLDETGRGCYKAASGNICQGDTGGPVYCVNRCNRDKFQHVVVAVSMGGLGDNCVTDNPWANVFTDLHKLKDKLRNLIYDCRK